MYLIQSVGPSREHRGGQTERQRQRGGGGSKEYSFLGHASTGMHGACAEVNFQCVFRGLPPSETKSLTGLKLCHTGQMSRLLSFQGSAFPLSSHLSLVGSMGVYYHTQLCNVVSGDLNLGPHDCRPSTELTELSPGTEVSVLEAL